MNFLVGRSGEENDPRVRKLVAALRSTQIRRFIQTNYHGAVLPAF